MSLGATIALEDASRRVWDAIVIGAGPAGALAARETGRRGASVLLVDRARFPRYKVCGGCLNPRSLRALRKVGLGRLVQSLGAVPLTGLRLGANGRFADIHLPTGAGVSREALDTALAHEAIQSGVAFLPGVTATLPRHDSARRRVVRLREGSREFLAEARVVIAAGGLGSKLEEQGENGVVNTPQRWESGSRIGAGVMIVDPVSFYQPHVIYMACSTDGYVGQVLVEGNQMDVAAAFDPMAVKAAGGTGELAVQILERAGFPVQPGLASMPWKGTPHLTRRSQRLAGERLFILGDAAGYIEPFTGEGMAWALTGATKVAPLAMHACANGWDASLRSRWAMKYRRAVSRRQFVCRLTADLLRHRLTTNVMVRMLGTAPFVAKPFLGYMYRD